MSTSGGDRDQRQGEKSNNNNGNNEEKTALHVTNRPRRNNHHRNKNRPLDPDVRTSKALSWALRHAAPQLGLDMGPDGYVPLAQLLSHTHPKFRGMTLDSVQRVVSCNDKQRFSLIERKRNSKNDNSGIIDCSSNAENSEWYIRANQGHSITTIDPYQLLTPIDPNTLPTIVHGTYMDPWINHIQTEGLSRMSRTHIHFAKGMPSDEGVVSGMRHNCGVYIFVDAAKCASDQITFLESANGVVLTAGVDGVLPPRYFSHVVTKSGETLLDQRKLSNPNLAKGSETN